LSKARFKNQTGESPKKSPKKLHCEAGQKEKSPTAYGSKKSPLSPLAKKEKAP